MNAESISRSKDILANNSLSPTEIAIVYHLAVYDIPSARSSRGIARSFHKDRRNISRVLSSLEQRSLIFRTGDLWSLAPENVLTFSSARAKP